MGVLGTLNVNSSRSSELGLTWKLTGSSITSGSWETLYGNSTSTDSVTAIGSPK